MARVHGEVSSRRHEGWHQLASRFPGARRAVGAFAALALLVAIAAGQSTSQLNGSVSDPSGASVAGAKITLTDAATGLQRNTTSNGSGLYQFLDVPPGNYRLEATAPGLCLLLGPERHAGGQNTLHAKRSLSGCRVDGTEVNGRSQAPLINRTDASLGNVIENAQIAELPIADRNVIYLLSLQPGVAYLGEPPRQSRHGHT